MNSGRLKGPGRLMVVKTIKKPQSRQHNAYSNWLKSIGWWSKKYSPVRLMMHKQPTLSHLQPAEHVILAVYIDNNIDESSPYF